MKIPFAAGIAAAAALATSAPASAATIAFDFGANGAGLNTGADPDVYSLTVGGLTVTARAYNGLSAITDWVYLGSQADVTHTSGGLGVRGNDSGQINDEGFFSDGEGILLTFNQEVTLTQALFTNFGRGDSVDFEWGSPINASGLETLDTLNVDAGGAFNGSFTGTQFFFAANALTSQGFRIDGVSVTGAVPEPGTWLTMILGFGLIGGVMRRKSAPRLRYDFA